MEVRPGEVREDFDPEAYGLPKEFRLTKTTELKGWGCKVPQESLLKLLKGLEDNENTTRQPHEQIYTLDEQNAHDSSATPKYGD